MTAAHISWRDRFPDEATCIRCLDVHPTDDLDRLLWCPGCRRTAARRAQWWGWGVGLLLAAALALWIALVVRPSPDLILGPWIATVVAAFYLGSKIAREVAYGVQRFRNRRAAEAVPPAGAEPDRDALDRRAADSPDERTERSSE